MSTLSNTCCMVRMWNTPKVVQLSEHLLLPLHCPKPCENAGQRPENTLYFHVTHLNVSMHAANTACPCSAVVFEHGHVDQRVPPPPLCLDSGCTHIRMTVRGPILKRFMKCMPKSWRIYFRVAMPYTCHRSPDTVKLPFSDFTYICFEQ